VSESRLERAPASAAGGTWSIVGASLTRPYRVTLPMIVLVALVPLYIFIPQLLDGRTLHAPALALDRALPLLPGWSIVYGAAYLFLIVLPVLVVRGERAIRDGVRAYLLVWITAYACFLAYPTLAPRPAVVAGTSFGAWGLRALYSADVPYNCFPSLHVAHSFVSALVCRRVHRGVGLVAMICAAVVGVSTLFSKQHYVLDVIAGIALAGVAGAVFLRDERAARVPDVDRRAAPALALALGLVIALGVVGAWVVYRGVR